MDPASEATASNAFSAGGDSGKPRNPKTSASRLQSVEHALTEEHLARFASRAAAYDRENRFFEEDFEELRAAKYLLLPVPSEFGGAGAAARCEGRVHRGQQRRLERRAPRPGNELRRPRSGYDAAVVRLCRDGASLRAACRARVRPGTAARGT